MPFLTESLYRGHVHRTLANLDRRSVMESRKDVLPQPRIPTHEEIAKLAYSYWEAGGRRHGSELGDWLSAERILRNR